MYCKTRENFLSFFIYIMYALALQLDHLDSYQYIYFGYDNYETVLKLRQFSV